MNDDTTDNLEWHLQVVSGTVKRDTALSVSLKNAAYTGIMYEVNYNGQPSYVSYFDCHIRTELEPLRR